MTELLIKNGFVFDPLNGINGEKMDIAVKNGKIVKSVNEKKSKKIDATGLTVMPGGVDIHTHIAGAEVNTGRLMRPEDHVRMLYEEPRSPGLEWGIQFHPLS